MIPGADFDRFIRQLKQLVDAQVSYGYTSHGPLRIVCDTVQDRASKPPYYRIRIGSGWDENYGGGVEIIASPTGRSLRVAVTGEVGGVTEVDSIDA